MARIPTVGTESGYQRTRTTVVPKSWCVVVLRLTRLTTGDLDAVELCEQDTVYYSNGQVKDPVYKGGQSELILVDDTVCYYKRR